MYSLLLLLLQTATLEKTDWTPLLIVANFVGVIVSVVVTYFLTHKKNVADLGLASDAQSLLKIAKIVEMLGMMEQAKEKYNLLNENYFLIRRDFTELKDTVADVCDLIDLVICQEDEHYNKIKQKVADIREDFLSEQVH